MPPTGSSGADPAFLEWTPISWSDAVAVASAMSGWVFRGQAMGWKLQTTLERLAKSGECSLNQLAHREEQIVEHFQRQALQYLPQAPEAKDHLEWLSIIQHHGGPTRL